MEEKSSDTLEKIQQAALEEFSEKMCIRDRNNYSVDPIYDGQAALAYAESGNYRCV